MNELSTTPDDIHGEHGFTITHPFHPICGQAFPLLTRHFAWGEERVFFPDPQTHEVRSLPLAWTSLAPPDPFLIVADGKLYPVLVARIGDQSPQVGDGSAL